MTYVLITGASSGIGFELAKIFAKHKHDLVLVAKDKAALVEKAKLINETYKVKVVALAKDLSFSNSAKEIYEELKKKEIEIDVLVNNAGFGSATKLVDNDYDNNAQMIGVNVSSLTLLTQLFLKDMVARKKGKIMNMSSVAAYLPGEEMAVYFATKAYVTSFSNSVNEELRGTGVTLTCVCPGPTRTNFEKRAKTSFDNWHPMAAEEVALEAYNGLVKGKKIVVTGTRNKLVVALSKVLPVSVMAFFMRKME